MYLKGDMMQSSFNVTQFTTDINKYSAYLLGFIWADGYLSSSTLRNNKNKICVEITTEDFSQIENIVDNTGHWTKASRLRLNRKPQSMFMISNSILWKFLMEHNYGPHTHTSADSILNHIPINYRHYWWQGYFDGDGCIYTNTKHYLYHLSFCSSYHQDWSFVIDLFKTLNINNYEIRQRIQGKNQHSVIRTTNKYEIEKFYKYIYPNGYEFGLRRKYDKFLRLPNLFKVPLD